jgi:uncharacterized membrane protein YphA (DoxX/SURF4 family)
LAVEPGQISLSIVQRLFSMFPTGFPGIALLLLRLVVTATFLNDGTAHLTLVNAPWALVLSAGIAISLCIGVFTPYSSIFIIIVELWAAYCTSGRDSFHLAVSILNSGILALLGPGAYSIDARVFGRRLIRLPPRKRS